MRMQAESSAVYVAHDLLGSGTHGGGAWAGLGLSLALALLRHSPSRAETLLPSILSAIMSTSLVLFLRPHLESHPPKTSVQCLKVFFRLIWLLPMICRKRSVQQVYGSWASMGNESLRLLISLRSSYPRTPTCLPSSSFSFSRQL